MSLAFLALALQGAADLALAEARTLTVSVTDDKERYVSGLTEAEFEVLEDGVRQRLSFFTRDALPLSSMGKVAKQVLRAELEPRP